MPSGRGSGPAAYFFVYYEITYKVSRESQHPRDGIRRIQGVKCMMGLKIGTYPHYPEKTGTYEGNNHRCDRISKSSDRPDKNIHYAASEVWYAYPAHSDKSVSDHLRI